MAGRYHNEDNKVYGEIMTQEYHSGENYVYVNNEKGRINFMIQHNLPQPARHKPTTADLHKSSIFSSY